MPMKKRANQKKESEMSDSWLLPYADMLTLLLALFIVLFAMSKIDIEKYERLTNIFKSEFSSSYIPITESPGGSGEGELSPRHAEQQRAEDEADESADKEVAQNLLIVTKQLTEMQENINAYIT